MAGIPAGRLSIEIVAEIARLQSDLDKAKRAVNAASKDIAASAKYANDNLAGMSGGFNKASGNGRMFAQQMSQVAQQTIAGGNAVQALALQLPDIVSQLNASGQSANKFAAFMGGPWGILLTSAVAVLVTLGVKMLEAEDATKKAEKASRSFADVLRDGKSSYDEITKAAKEYADQQIKSRELTIDQIEYEANLIGMRQGHTRVLRLMLDAELEMSKLRTELATESGSAEAMIVARRKQVDIEERLKKNREAMAQIDRDAMQVAIKAADEIAKLRTDEEYRLRSGFDLQRKRARENIHDVQELAERQAQINRAQEAALDRLREKGKAASNDALKLAKVTGEEIAKALGTTITSGLRTPAQNRAAKGAENSYHLTGQAIDIPLTVNGKPITKAWIRQMLEPLGVQIKELLGPGDKNHDDHFHIAFALKRLTPDQVADAQEDARKAAEKVAEAWNKVLEDLATSVVQARVDTAAQVEKMIGDAAGVDWDNLEKGLAAFRAGINREREERDRQLEDDRQRALDTAHEIADIVGGGIGRAIAELADALIPLLDITKGLGKALEDFGKGARLGGAVGGLAGSGSGGALGGGLGQALFSGNNAIGQAVTKGLNKVFQGLGQFAGPLGAIAGGLLGGIIGGMLTSTPRASATVSIIAGKAMETAITGNSDKLKKIAGGMADGLIAGLEKIASSLGAEIVGDARVSVGVRKGNYRVDPTGQGITKTSRGAIDFGEDKAAAEAYALLVALRQLDFTGVSASVKTLLTLTDDLASNLEKATQFKSVFDELAKRDDPAKFAQDEITRWHDAMAKIFAEAGATAEELAELERLTGLKRVDAAKEAADAITRAAEEAAAKAKAVADEAAGLNLRLAEALGNSEEVLRLRREAELATVDPLNRALLETVHAAESAAIAAADLAEKQEAAAAAAKALADASAGLDMRILQAKASMGDTGAAAALGNTQLNDFLNSLPEELRGKGIETWNIEQTAKSAADMAAAEAARIAANRQNSETRWAEMQAAVDAQRSAANDNAADYNAEMRSRLTAAYERESDAMQTVIDQFTEMAKTLKEFRAGLFGQENGFQTFGSLQARLTRAGSLARGGDLAAMQSIPGLGNDFLTAARGQASSLLDYQRNVAFVASIADQAVAGAEEQVDIEHQKLDLMNKQVEGQIDTNKKLDTVIDLVDDIVSGRVAIRTEAA